VPPEPGGRPPGVDELLEGGYTHGKDPRDDHEADPAPTPSELTPASGTGTPPPDPKVRDEKTDKEYQRQDKDRDKDNKNTRFALPQDDPKYDPHAHDKPKPKHKGLTTHGHRSRTYADDGRILGRLRAARGLQPGAGFAVRRADARPAAVRRGCGSARFTRAAFPATWPAGGPGVAEPAPPSTITIDPIDNPSVTLR
jgi:hypothetical protein